MRVHVVENFRHAVSPSLTPSTHPLHTYPLHTHVHPCTHCRMPLTLVGAAISLSLSHTSTTSISRSALPMNLRKYRSHFCHMQNLRIHATLQVQAKTPTHFHTLATHTHTPHAHTTLLTHTHNSRDSFQQGLRVAFCTLVITISPVGMTPPFFFQSRRFSFLTISSP